MGKNRTQGLTLAKLPLQIHGWRYRRNARTLDMGVGGVKWIAITNVHIWRFRDTFLPLVAVSLWELVWRPIEP